MITIVISAISPAFAYSATDGFNPVSFWEYVYRGFGGGNRDGGFGGGGFGGSDPDSWTTSDDMKNDYNDFVSTLPATGYNSAGKLLWQPKWSDAVDNQFGFAVYYSRVDSSAFFIKPGVEDVFCGKSSQYDYTASFSGSDLYISRSALTSASSRSERFQLVFSNYGDMVFAVPIAGSYKLLKSPAIVASCETGLNSNFYTQTNYDWDAVGSRDLGAGGYFYNGFSYKFWDVAQARSVQQITVSSYRANIRVTTPVFEVTPLASDTTTINNTYNINTRVNNFQGDYYDNVTNNYYNNTTIINETTNNYYDMTTNNYYTMSNWSYDYQSRTYFVTLEDGTTITVQFGDDCLTITNNNVENSYQYVINNNNTPSPNPETPSTCKHNWTETIDVAPTCLEGGHANFTCSLCGETYEQILSAKGHNWTVKEHVNTVYGESGVIVTQGHTLYECSACGEQWYTETATPPPDVSGGSNILAWLQEFKTWLGDKLDNLFQGDGDTNNFWSTNKKSFTDVLSSLLQTLLDFLTDILEKLLGLVKDLLSFLFDLLSSVVITGISDFFTGLKDSRLFDFVTKDDEGSAVALPEGVAAVFAFFSGVILALPVELRSILLFGTALIVLIGVIKIIKS